MIEKVKTSIIACTAQHQKQIAEKLKESAKSISLDDRLPLVQIADSISDISWTNIDSAMLATDFILGNINGLNLGPIVMIGQAVTGFVRQKEIAKKQHDFLDSILQNFNNIVNEVQNELKSVYERIKNSSIDNLNNMYNNKIEQSIVVIKQTKHLLYTEKMKIDDIVNYLNETIVKISDLKLILKKYGID